MSKLMNRRPFVVGYRDMIGHNSVLRCRSCGADSLCHSCVVVFDGDTGAVTIVEHDRTAQPRELVTGWRRGLLICFRCAACGVESKLGLTHHEGQTFAGWYYGGAAERSIFGSFQDD